MGSGRDIIFSGQSSISWLFDMHCNGLHCIQSMSLGFPYIWAIPKPIQQFVAKVRIDEKMMEKSRFVLSLTQ